MTQFAKKIIQTAFFKGAILLTILFSAVVVGLETYSEFASEHGKLLKQLDLLIIGIFTIEIVLKLMANYPRPLNYFKDAWNVFDFIIVVLCYLPAEVFFLSILRIVRLLRVLRLISVLPKLQLLVNTLIKSIPSISYVILLLTLLFYIYAVIGSFLFGKNDPLHFGSLHVSMLTLFGVVTLEGWFDILKINMYGCSGFGYESNPELCIHSSPNPVAAVIYFISFILLGSMIFINLFIGVVMNSMSESERELSIQRLTGKGEDNIAQHIKNLEIKLDILKNDLQVISEIIKRKIN